jgi:hypothetical protein
MAVQQLSSRKNHLACHDLETGLLETLANDTDETPHDRVWLDEYERSFAKHLLQALFHILSSFVKVRFEKSTVDSF